MNEDRHVWEVVIVVNDITKINTRLRSTVEGKVVWTGRIQLLVLKDRISELCLERDVGRPVRASTDPFFVYCWYDYLAQRSQQR
jgi:hypothetical protein